MYLVISLSVSRVWNHPLLSSRGLGLQCVGAENRTSKPLKRTDRCSSNHDPGRKDGKAQYWGALASFQKRLQTLPLSFPFHCGLLLRLYEDLLISPSSCISGHLQSIL